MLKTGIWRTVLLLFLFFAFTLAVINVDVQPIAVENITGIPVEDAQTTDVGFASINSPAHAALPYSGLFYKVTTLLGYVALLFVAGYGLLGVMQLIRRKSFKKVDFQLYALGIFFVLMLVCYVIFEKLPINYRPVLLDAQEGLEASYPSSHTMLALCVFGAMMVPYPQLFSSGKAFTYIRIGAGILMAVSVAGRVLSGVHWVSDIVGALLLSAALISLYVAMLQIYRLKHPDRPQHSQPAGNWDDSTMNVDDGFGDLFRPEE